MPKSNAQRVRECRQRLRLVREANSLHTEKANDCGTRCRTKKKPMTVAERVRNYRARQKAILNGIMPKKKTNLSSRTRNTRRLKTRMRLVEGSSEEEQEEGGEPCSCRERMCALELRICHMEQLLERVLSQLEEEEEPTPSCSEGESVVMGQPGMAAPVPLHEAAERGDAAALVRALVRGADPNALDQCGDTALHCAARAGETLSVELLLAAGAALDAPDARGASPLAVAVCRGRHGAAELLLERGAQVEHRDKDRHTPLMRAVALWDTQMVSLLVKHNASVNVADCNGVSPLVIAARDCLTDILRLLVCNANPFAVQVEQAMNVAGSSAAFMILVQAMPMVATCPVKSSALEHVAREGWWHPVRTILNKCQCQRDLHVKNIQSAIMVAKTEDILHVLWKSRPSTTRRVAMNRAAAMGWDTVLEDIVSHWKNSKSRKTNDFSEIVDATRNVTTPEAALCLVQAHPLILCTTVGREIASRAAERGWYKILEMLINSGVPVDSKLNGSSLLHSAASRGNPECVQMLLLRGASVRERDDDGWTALHCAAEAGHSQVVEVLLKQGADPAAKGPGGLTPYDVAETESVMRLLKLLQ